VNVAVTLLAASIVTVQVAVVPVHAPLHLAKVERSVVTTAKVTLAALGKLAVQVSPQ